MADNIDVTPGTGKTIAGDDIGGVLHQRVKVVIGNDGTNDGDISATNPMPVTIISGESTTVTADIGTTGGLALDATLTGGSQKSILRSGTKGGTSAADVTSTNVDANTQALDVSIKGTPAVTVSSLPALPAGSNAIGSVSVSNFPSSQAVTGTVSVTQATGTNLHTTVDNFPSSQAVTGPLTDTQLRATAVPVSGTVTANAGTGTFAVSASALPLPSGASTSALQTTGNTSLGNIDTKTPSLGQALSAASVPVVLPAAQITTLTPPTSVGVNNFPATQAVSIATMPTTPVTGTFFQATQPVSIASSVTVTGPLTDIQLRATPVPISGTVTATTGGLTDTQLRASAVPVSLTSTTVTGSVAVTGPLTDTQLRASAVPVSGTVTANLGTVSGLALDATLTGGTQQARITDGTNVASVKAASTAAVAADKAIVVAVSPNNTVGVTGTFYQATQPVSIASMPSTPVTGTFWQTTQPISGTITANAGTGTMSVSAASLPLPTGAATETTLSALNTKAPALGQALAASSIPVVLTAAQITTLTPPTTVTANAGTGTMAVSAVSLPLPTGAATETTLSGLNTKVTTTANGIKVDGSAVTQPVTGTVTANAGTGTFAVSASALPLPTGAATSALQTTGNTSVASIDTKTPVLGQALAASSVPVVLPAAQITALTPPSSVGITGSVAVTGSFYQATQPVSIATMPTTPVTGTFFQATQPVSIASSVAVTGPLTDTQLRATAVPISATQLTNGTQLTQIVDSTGVHIDAINSAGTNNLLIALGATNYAVSTVNSTTAQLAAGATFTGTVETTFNQQSYSILVNSDQSGILTLKQYIDAAGTFSVSTLTYPIAAGADFCRSGVINGNYTNIIFQNTGASATTTLNINTAYGTIPSATQLNNAPISLQEVNGTVISLGQTTPSLSLPVTIAKPLAYIAAAADITPTTTGATDIFIINGSASKTIRINRILVSGTKTTAGQNDFRFIKRSTANSAGTSTAVTPFPVDSSFAAATATAKYYTANPTVGTPVGDIYSQRVYINGTAPGTSFNGPFTIIDVKFGNSADGNPIVLRGTAEGLAINADAGTLTGGVFYITVEFTEE